MESVVEIAKALLTDPPIIIRCGVALMQHIRTIFHHKFGPAKRAVIVVPFRVFGVSTILTVNERNSREEFLLISEAPIALLVARAHRPNDNKMSDGGRDRALLGVEVGKSSQKWNVQRSAVRSIVWLGLFRVTMLIKE